MLKAEQIPDAVARLADEAYYDTAGDNPAMSDEDIMKHAIAAALNAWPGVWLEDREEINLGAEVEPLVHHARVVLPLPQEKRDGK